MKNEEFAAASRLIGLISLISPISLMGRLISLISPKMRMAAANSSFYK